MKNYAPDVRVLLTKADLAEWFQVSKATVNRWIRNGVLPPPLPTPSPRWLWKDVLEHLKERGEEEKPECP